MSAGRSTVLTVAAVVLAAAVVVFWQRQGSVPAAADPQPGTDVAAAPRPGSTLPAPGEPATPRPDPFRPEFAEARAVLAANPLVRGQQTRVAVELQVARGYHVNANPAAEEWLIPTSVDLESVSDIQLVAAFYPAAQEREFDFWSGPLKVYEGSVVIGVVLDVSAEAALGGRDLHVAVTYQACNDEACFSPTQARYRLSTEVAPAGTAALPFQSPLLARARFESGGN